MKGEREGVSGMDEAHIDTRPIRGPRKRLVRASWLSSVSSGAITASIFLLGATLVVDASSTHAVDIAALVSRDPPEPEPETVVEADTHPPHVIEAFRIVDDARLRLSDGPRAPSPRDVFERAAIDMGYVPAGVDPGDVHVPGAPFDPTTGRLIEGKAMAVTGDTVAVGGETLALRGAEAPGPDISCTSADGTPYDCAAWSLEGLGHVVAGQDVSCLVADEASDGVPASGWCNLPVTLGGTRDLAQVLVRAGIVMAGRSSPGLPAYADDEEGARSRALGLWSGAISLRDN